MLIDTDFDGGRIDVIDASDPQAIELALRPDTAAEFMQNFAFRLTLGDAVPSAGRSPRIEGVPCVIRIANAGDATYADAWDGYHVLASYDREHWFRVPTEFDGEALTIRHTPIRDTIVYAYYAAYPESRHAAVVEAASNSPRARVLCIGESVLGRPMNLIVVGNEPEPDDPRRRIWITARQHPGESMAEWFAEGLVAKLLDETDDLAQKLLEDAVFYVVPRMNPDGASLGNHRTNAAGTDLNRAWVVPSEATSPEICAVQRAMESAGVDLHLDIHGDERQSYAFAAGCEGNPDYTPRLAALEDLFIESLVAFDDRFSRRRGYDRDEPGQADLRVAANWVSEHFDCLALTLEMPFREDEELPANVAGWSPQRCRRFGAASLASVAVCLDSLR